MTSVLKIYYLWKKVTTHKSWLTIGWPRKINIHQKESKDNTNVAGSRLYTSIYHQSRELTQGHTFEWYGFVANRYRNSKNLLVLVLSVTFDQAILFSFKKSNSIHFPKKLKRYILLTHKQLKCINFKLLITFLARYFLVFIAILELAGSLIWISDRCEIFFVKQITKQKIFVIFL